MSRFTLDYYDEEELQDELSDVRIDDKEQIMNPIKNRLSLGDETLLLTVFSNVMVSSRKDIGKKHEVYPFLCECDNAIIHTLYDCGEENGYIIQEDGFTYLVISKKCREWYPEKLTVVTKVINSIQRKRDKAEKDKGRAR